MKSRLIALLLSLTLCISLSVPALAMCKDERSSSYTDGLISFDSDVEIEEALVRVAQEKIVCHYGWPGKSCIYVNRDLRTNIWGDYVIAELEY